MYVTSTYTSVLYLCSETYLSEDVAERRSGSGVFGHLLPLVGSAAVVTVEWLENEVPTSVSYYGNAMMSQFVLNSDSIVLFGTYFTRKISLLETFNYLSILHDLKRVNADFLKELMQFTSVYVSLTILERFRRKHTQHFAWPEACKLTLMPVEICTRQVTQDDEYMCI